MQQIINTEQAQAWNGYEGTHWADNHNRWNAVLSGINDELFARPQSRKTIECLT
ncbi:hypothetical protein [Nonomuraea sp. 10N515B]|uniref:hypothetical protein n=1 Tax=Nonomuraea sp. 10N515B TaxID=3457422 RepID=UPI003FCEDFB4